ncbi:MAG: serine hydrolase domain-containing protein [Rhodanobacter sp.]
MKRWNVSILVAIAFVGAWQPTLATDASPALLKRIDGIFADYNASTTPGCALALVDHGRTAYERGYGLASIEHGVAIDPHQTVFDIGSLSKQFTAASILLLEHDHKLSLDDDIRTYVPELPDYGAVVTLRQLLHHTSGISDYLELLDLDGINPEDVATDDDALRAIVRKKTLDFPPGSEFSYSNSGYFLLSLVVKRVSGKPLNAFAKEHIFDPLGMSATSVLGDHTRIIAHRATSYDSDEPGKFRLSPSNWEQTGDGGVQSTVDDLAKWDENFYRPRVGGQWLVDELQTPGELKDGTRIAYASGVIVDHYRGLQTVSHRGVWAGFRAFVVRFPDQQVSAIALCNVGNANPEQRIFAVADLYLAGVLKALPTRQGMTSSRAQKYSGMYANLRQGKLRVFKTNGDHLLYLDGSGAEVELAYIGNNEFQSALDSRLNIRFLSTTTGARRVEVSPAGQGSLVFSEVAPFKPTAQDIRAYEGFYTSAELKSGWTLKEEKGSLTIRGERGPSIPLEPAFDDAFFVSNVLFRFERGEDRTVTGFTMARDRVRKLQFVRATP